MSHNDFMKKLLGLMLGLALIVGVTAPDASAATKKRAKHSRGKRAHRSSRARAKSA
jgi:hypothetical protein